MATAIENKLSNLIHEIKEIKKDIILHEIAKTRITKNSLAAWKTIGKRISEKWDGVSVTEEIAYQRDKTW